MRAFGIVGVHLRRKARTAVPEPSHQKVPDLIKRDFTAPAPNQRYAGDTTYLPVGDENKLRCSPSKGGHLAKAIAVLQNHEVTRG